MHGLSCSVVCGILPDRGLNPCCQHSVRFSSVAQSCPTLWPHGLQPSRLPCPSPTSTVNSNSCPSSQWCHPTISSSVIPFSSRLQSFPASGSFPMSQFFPSGGQSIGASASASVLPMNTQDWSFRMDWLDLLAVQGTLKSLFQHHSSKAAILWHSAFFIVQVSHPYMTTGTNHSLDWTDLCWQSNVSGFQYAVWVGHNFSSKEQASLNFMAAVTLAGRFLSTAPPGKSNNS